MTSSASMEQNCQWVVSHTSSVKCLLLVDLDTAGFKPRVSEGNSCYHAFLSMASILLKRNVTGRQLKANQSAITHHYHENEFDCH